MALNPPGWAGHFSVFYWLIERIHLLQSRHLLSFKVLSLLDTLPHHLLYWLEVLHQPQSQYLLLSMRLLHRLHTQWKSLSMMYSLLLMNRRQPMYNHQLCLMLSLYLQVIRSRLTLWFLLNLLVKLRRSLLNRLYMLFKPR